MDLQLSSDIYFLLKLIEINPYCFDIAKSVLKDNIMFVLLALKATQYPKFIYEKLNDALKEDPDVLDLVFPKSNSHVIAKRVNNNYSPSKATKPKLR